MKYKTIYNRAQGNFVKITKEMFLDKRISGNPFRLLGILLSNNDGYNINLTVEYKKLSWNRKQGSRAANVLRECGYLETITRKENNVLIKSTIINIIPKIKE